MAGIRILICGGRDYCNRASFHDHVRQVLTDREYQAPDILIIHGGAKGADTLAGEYAAENDLEVMEFKADWNKYGRAAGPMRNQKMLVQGKPDLVIAFPGGKGTAHMIGLAKNAGVEVIEV